MASHLLRRACKHHQLHVLSPLQIPRQPACSFASSTVATAEKGSREKLVSDEPWSSRYCVFSATFRLHCSPVQLLNVYATVGFFYPSQLLADHPSLRPYRPQKTAMKAVSTLGTLLTAFVVTSKCPVAFRGR